MSCDTYLGIYLQMLLWHASFGEISWKSRETGITNQHVGVNLLKNILSELSEKCDVDVHYATTHFEQQ